MVKKLLLLLCKPALKVRIYTTGYIASQKAEFFFSCCSGSTFLLLQFFAIRTLHGKSLHTSRNYAQPSHHAWLFFSFAIANRFHVAVRLFSNRSQMKSECGKNKKSGIRGVPECVTDVLTTF